MTFTHMAHRRFATEHLARRSGFSFLEMLIVLTILSALTMVAVQSLEPLGERAGHAVTQRTLDEIRTGIVNVRTEAGITVVSGLVADTSLLPNMSSSAAFYNSLSVGVDIPPASPYVADGMTANYGWRGPYVRANLTTTQFFADGWNCPFCVEIQDSSGTTKTNGFTQLSDRLVISNISSTTTTQRFVSTTITGSMLSATQLTVNMYGIDLTGNRIALSGGVNSPLTALPQVYLQGGLDPTTMLVTTITGTVTATGTACSCQITPQLPQMLVGVRTLSVITPTLTTTAEGHYEVYSPIQQINLLPGTSPIIDVLVVRQTSTVAEAPEEP